MYLQHAMASDSVEDEHQYRRGLADVVHIVPYDHMDSGVRTANVKSI